VFYPQLSADRSEACLLLDVDPIALVRGAPGSRDGGALEQYVNDRPYVASSFLSVAMSRVFGTAMNGRSKERQNLAEEQLDIETIITAVHCEGGEPFLHRLFEPLGYAVDAEHHVLDEKFPEWGEGPYYTVRLRVTGHNLSGRCHRAISEQVSQILSALGDSDWSDRLRGWDRIPDRIGKLGIPSRLEEGFTQRSGWADRQEHGFLPATVGPAARGLAVPLCGQAPSASASLQ
jgi:hypothetical protein